MRFTEFLRTTVLASAAAASLLAAVTIAGVATDHGPDRIGLLATGWWVVAALVGLWLGRRADASPPIAALLAGARVRRALPETNPARTLLARLWPLLVSCLGAAGVGIALPQVAAVAAGFAIIWSLAWRRQSSAVRAIEGRDGVRFYVEQSSPWEPIRLVRAPGFRTLPGDPAAAAARDGHPVGAATPCERVGD